jgi:hypothetical protein
VPGVASLVGPLLFPPVPWEQAIEHPDFDQLASRRWSRAFAAEREKQGLPFERVADAIGISVDDVRALVEGRATWMVAATWERAILALTVAGGPDL